MNEAKATSERERQLLTAIRLTCSDRNVTHGDPTEQHMLAGTLQQALQRQLANNHDFINLGRQNQDAILAILGQICIKLSRFATGTIYNTDTTIDGAAYFAILGEALVKMASPQVNPGPPR